MARLLFLVRDLHPDTNFARFCSTIPRSSCTETRALGKSPIDANDNRVLREKPVAILFVPKVCPSCFVEEKHPGKITRNYDARFSRIHAHNELGKWDTCRRCRVSSLMQTYDESRSFLHRLIS